jgi:hypothetical protein
MYGETERTSDEEEQHQLSLGTAIPYDKTPAQKMERLPIEKVSWMARQKASFLYDTKGFTGI